MSSLVWLLAEAESAGVRGDVALLWGGIATAAGGTMSAVIAHLWSTIKEDRAAHKTALEKKDADHASAIAAKDREREALRVECAAELKALHAAHVGVTERMAEAMRDAAREAREELCPACRAEAERGPRSSDERRRP